MKGLGHLLINLAIFRWLKIILIERHEQYSLWIFEQPIIDALDRKVLAIEAERGKWIAALPYAPDEYNWDYAATPYPEPPPKWRIRIVIKELTREHVRLQRQVDREARRIAGQMSYPPVFS